MTEFVVELYLSEREAQALGRDTERIRSVAEVVNGEGTPVRYLRWIFVPEDETCFLLFEAGSAEAVRQVAQRAEVEFERIAEAVEEAGGKEG